MATTRRNMAAKAGLRDALLAQTEGLKSPRTKLKRLLTALPLQDLKGYAKQYKDATGIRPYPGRTPNMSKAKLVGHILDYEFPKKSAKIYSRDQLKAADRSELVAVAQAVGVKAVGTSPKLINQILSEQDQKKKGSMAAREAGRLKLITGQGLKRQPKRRADYHAKRYGKGPFRYVIVSDGRIVVDAGPVPTARDASIAAKTLLRTRAKAFVHPISQAKGQALVDAGGTGLETHGRVVDGYVVENLDGAWEAFVYQPNDPNIAYAGGRGFERLMPTDRGSLSPLSLMNVPADFGAAAPRANSSHNYALTVEVDSIVKDYAGHRGDKAEAKAMIKEAYRAALSRFPSVAAGKRALGGVSDWYAYARDM